VLIGSDSGDDGHAQAFVSLHRGWFRAIWADLVDQCASPIKFARRSNHFLDRIALARSGLVLSEFGADQITLLIKSLC